MRCSIAVSHHGTVDALEMAHRNSLVHIRGPGDTVKVEELCWRAEGAQTCLLRKTLPSGELTWGLQQRPSLLTLSLLTASVTRMTASMAGYLARGWVGIDLSCADCGGAGSHCVRVHLCCDQTVVDFYNFTTGSHASSSPNYDSNERFRRTRDS